MLARPLLSRPLSLGIEHCPEWDWSLEITVDGLRNAWGWSRWLLFVRGAYSLLEAYFANLQLWVQGSAQVGMLVGWSLANSQRYELVAGAIGG